MGGIMPYSSIKANVFLSNARYNYVSIALIIGSFGKLLLTGMVIWNYELHYTWMLGLLVFTSNIEALKAFLNVNSVSAMLIVSGGLSTKFLFTAIFARFILRDFSILKELIVT
ncbi:sterol homeostasis protein [Entomophthora muscae]|uniref:Sterol homeostasis protein n=1 Tax=Entomophthora muscae TaxID=34485 RepID=A0ACC2TAZ0_9FUNG|nr:sterol homeostasis protein [Entomophthora muscae]